MTTQTYVRDFRGLPNRLINRSLLWLEGFSKRQILGKVRALSWAWKTQRQLRQNPALKDRHNHEQITIRADKWKVVKSMPGLQRRGSTRWGEYVGWEGGRGRFLRGWSRQKRTLGGTGRKDATHRGNLIGGSERDTPSTGQAALLGLKFCWGMRKETEWREVRQLNHTRFTWVLQHPGGRR